ncbi:FAD-dependent oxidoreductase [Corynebacterium sp. YIM 101645]|uniref:FAD-dependent oxidoreductase n=1 Tax=Corynebacterium lemuris TaxID=1859292 RepID=A0ABT2FSE6_9CORY|nr:FAD-dependent oxidoreductase [Corynebacterium lemuris]MCS5478133.1 FAD-dependent oxidoreductase [Corynebacterium lemuris]
MVNQDIDVIVIGAGIAGLSTAARAAEQGMRVLLVEKMSAIGGSSAMSGGWFAFTGTEEQKAAGVEDSIELFRSDLRKVGAYRNNPALVEAYMENQFETYEWLRAKGVSFGEVEISSGQSAPRGHSTRIREVLQLLHDDFSAHGGETLFDAPVTALHRDAEGRVTGITISDGRQFTAVLGVVIASGGFSRSRELLSVFAPEQLAAIPYGGPGNTGDGLRMAWKLGAGMADMSAISGTYGSHPETTDEQQELLTSYYMGGIIVNVDGRRFVDESLDYKTLGSAVLTQPEALAFQIFDAPVRALSHRGIALKDMDTLEDFGHLPSAPTLEELADTVGIPAGQLVDTIEKYNDAVRGAGADEVGRTNLCNGVGDLRPIETGPFYAYPAKTLMTTTYGGITFTPEGRVTDVDGDIIDGLFAVGEVTGGFHGAAYMTGSSLGKGAVFGRIVAETLVRSYVGAVNG